jgi:erythromycin esterase-like protein
MAEFSSWLRAENTRRGPTNAIELVGVYGYTYFPNKLEALRARLQTSGRESRSRLLREVPTVDACEQLDPAFASDEHWARARQRDPVLALMVDSIRRCDVAAAASASQPGELFAAEVCQRVLSMSGRPAKAPRKLVLLAHDGHVARERVGRIQEDILGQYLASSLGARYRAVGVTVGTGTFNGSFYDPKSGYAPGHRTLELDSILAGSLESVLNSGGESFFLPSRSPEGELWPGPVRSTRDIGASYSPPFAQHYWSPVLLQNTYDAIVYVPRVEPIIERPWGR